MTPAPTTRSPTFYRITLATAAAGLGYVVASGRLAAYMRFFRDAARSAAPPQQAVADHMVTALIWLACLAPLLYASWGIGRQHVRGRRLGYALVVGFVSVFRIAVRGELAPAEAQAFAGAPSDRVSRAALWGGAVGVRPGVLPNGCAAAPNASGRALAVHRRIAGRNGRVLQATRRRVRSR